MNDIVDIILITSMIPNKNRNATEYREYIALHYKLQKYYRKWNPYVPFKYIQKKINQKWQLTCYDRMNRSIQDVEDQQQPMIRWADNLEQVKLF